MLRGKKILLGVTGSISAYKAVSFVRLLTQAGADVRVVLTPSALEFVTPVTFSTLSHNAVFSSLLKNEETGEWVNHVDLGAWPDLFIIAPASANTIAKMVHGKADNLLLTTWLSAKSPVMVAPAMDHDMYHHFATQENLKKLKSQGIIVIDPEKGELASGLVGDGRLPEPENLVKRITEWFIQQQYDGKLIGKKVMLTAGPTVEEIDPVRFVSNHSTGKMGYALAEVLIGAGADVILISGPVSLEKPKGLHQFISVKSADEMLKACQQNFSTTDIVIMAAAVADYRPKTKADQKIKKKDDTLSIELIKNPDIVSELTKHKKHQLVVGFALETNNETENAQQKLKSKNLDLIVLNSLNDPGAGFGVDTNKITIIGTDNKIIKFELQSKLNAAKEIVNVIASKI